MNEKDLINNFKEFLEEYEIKENEITYEDLETYITSLHYDLIDEYENIEDVALIEEDIEDLLHENFKIIIND